MDPLGSFRRGNDVIMVRYLMFHLDFSLNNGNCEFLCHILKSDLFCFHSFMTFICTARVEKELRRKQQPIRKKENAAHVRMYFARAAKEVLPTGE